MLFVTATKDDEPLGSMYLASMVEKEGHKVEAVILDWDNIFEVVEFFQPDVIAYSVITGQQKKYLAINSALKSQYTFLSVWGGAHVTFFPQFIENYGVDMVCVGEGELAFVELLDKLQTGQDVRSVENFWVKINNIVYKNECRLLIENLDSIPFPNRRLYNRYKVDNDYDVITSRGCVYNCSFCHNHQYNSLYIGKGKVPRYRSVENVIQELEEICSLYSPSIFKFHDDLFIFNKERVKDFCEQYRRRVGKPFTCSARVDILDEEIVSMLKSAGCRAVFMGIESGDEAVREKILRRSMSNEQILKSCELLHKYGILIVAQNMIGIPGTGIEEDWQTLELNVACKPYLAWVSICTPYPGTDLVEMSKEAGLISDNFIDEIPEAYYIRTMLKIPHATQVNNLNKLFPLGVEYPDLLPRISQLLSNENQDWFEEMRVVLSEFRRYKYYNLMDERMKISEAVRSFVDTNLQFKGGEFYV